VSSERTNLLALNVAQIQESFFPQISLKIGPFSSKNKYLRVGYPTSYKIQNTRTQDANTTNTLEI
jgi:hypothetical protein